MHFRKQLSILQILFILVSLASATAQMIKAQSVSLKVIDAYWTVDGARITTTKVGVTVVAHVKVKAEDGTAQGMLTLKIKQDATAWFDEDYAIHEVSIVLTSGTEKEYIITFVPFDASGEDLKNVLGEPELRGYYIEVEFKDDTIYTMKSTYPPRLTVSAPFWAICVADATVHSGEADSNNGGESYLGVSDTSQEYFGKIERAYLRFDVSGLPEEASIESALLKARTSMLGGTHKVGAHYCSDISWKELEITWSNSPEFNEEVLDEIVVSKDSTWYGWDITEALKEVFPIDEVSITLISEDKQDLMSSLLWFYSKDQGYDWMIGYKPRLALYFSLPKAATSITCRVSPISASTGDEVTITGQISPSVEGKDVDITITAPDGSKRSLQKKTGSDGSYSGTFTLDQVGTWKVSTSWDGDAEYEGATSSEVSIAVTKASTTISIRLSESEIIVGDSITVSGSIDPAFSGAIVTITFTKPDSSTFTRTDSTASDGSYSESDNPIETGSWSVKASWDGDPTYSGATSQTLVFNVVEAPPPCSLKIIVKDEKENPISGVMVSSTSQPSGQQTLSGSSGTDGSVLFSDVKLGSYTFQASKTEYITKSGTLSTKAGETVELTISLEKEAKKGCIIATATYGSELSPEVKFLRDFRDDKVLKTFAGSCFMTVFNAWYYSFSPRLASEIATNIALRSFMKIMLYPLIGLLHLASTTYSFFGFYPEFAVVVSGLIASCLIGIVYFSPLALLTLIFIGQLRSSKIKKKIVNMLATPWLMSVFLLLVGEISASPIWMMFASAMFVLTTLSTSAIIITMAAKRKHEQ